MKTDRIALVEALRNVLKAKKITYQNAADHLGVSLATIKRVFSGQECSLDRIIELCGLVEMSFFELVDLAKSDVETSYFLTEEQEIFFSADPGKYAVFRDLYKGRELRKVMGEWQLNAKQIYRFLRELEQLGLLEVSQGNKFRFKIRGMLRLNLKGPLATNLLRGQNIAFIDHVYADVSNPLHSFQSIECSVSEATLKELVNEFHELGRRYRARALKEERLLQEQDQVSIRWFIACAPYKTSWLDYGIKL